MVLIGAKRFKIEVGRCPQGCHPAVRVEICEYLGKEEFRKRASDFRRLFMYVESTRPWRWYRIFSSQEEATGFAMELARSLGEAAFLDERSRLCLVMPSREELRKA